MPLVGSLIAIVFHGVDLAVICGPARPEASGPRTNQGLAGAEVVARA